MTLDISDFYLNTEMEIKEYMKMALDLIPPEITKQYNLLAIAHSGFV